MKIAMISDGDIIETTKASRVRSRFLAVCCRGNKKQRSVGQE